MANRLSGRHDVTLLEAGSRDHRWDFRLHMPAALSEVLATDRYNWSYHTEPEASLGDRRLYCPRGKVLGGSSSINGMIFVRGNPGDFNRWRDAYGLSDWGYEDCLPYFKRSETCEFDADAALRGTDGPLRISRASPLNVLSRQWLAAGEQAGFKRQEDLNGAQQEGVGCFDRTISKGRRFSTARAYLDHARRLRTITKARVTQLHISQGRVTGVEYLRDGQRHSIEAEREVILCAGAINTPQILMLSGIGEPAHLKTHGIDCQVPLNDVGQHLQDHLEIYVQYACPRPVSIYPVTRWPRKGLAGVEWYLAHSGPCASNHFEVGGFMRSGLDDGYPDLQFHFLPIAMDYDGKNQFRGHGFQVHVGPMKPTSRGSVTLQSASPLDPPVIRFNYNATQADRDVMQAGINLARDIVQQSAFDAYRGVEIRPGTGSSLDEFVSNHGESAYHPAGTCRMGVDPGAVVDAQGRVNGIEGLRVVDASIMPEITNGNLNSPVVMMAEKVSDYVLGIK